MIITIITDNINSWFIPFGEILQKELQKKGHIVYYVTDKSEIKKGEVCFILSCSKIIEEE
jgi:methionyl-tRNA formyltransferase